VVLVCVSNASACEEIFLTKGFAGKLKNKTLIQYSTMSPKESADFADWAEKANAGYLDGSILGLPQGVREGTLKILYSGPETLFNQVQPILEALGDPVWLGNKHGTAFMADKVVYAQFYGIHFTYMLVAALGQAAGISVENLKMLIGGGDRWKMRGQMIDTALDMASSRDYAGNECALDVHLDAFKHAVQLSEDTGVGVEFMHMVAQAMNEAIEKGHAKDELPSIFEAFSDDKT